jgi:hypothetical protein
MKNVSSLFNENDIDIPRFLGQERTVIFGIGSEE